MKFVADNFKKIGIFNIVLLAVALTLAIYRFAHPASNSFTVFRDIVYMISVVFSFLYTFSWYKKNAAEYYKLFMFSFAVFAIMAVVVDLNGLYSVPVLVLRIIVAICALVLTFAKDLGKRNSMVLAYVLAGSQLISCFIKFSFYQGGFRHIASAFMHLVLACVACVFVMEKYSDKEARGKMIR